MKKLFCLILLIFFTINTFSQDNYVWRRGFRNVVGADTLSYRLQDEYFYLNVPNLIKLDTKSSEITNLKVQNGRSEKIAKDIYAIYPDKLGDVLIEITASNVFKLHHNVVSLPNPKLHLENKLNPFLISNRVLNLEDLSGYELTGNWYDYTYKIIGFTVSAVVNGFNCEEYAYSNKFSAAQKDLINQVFQNHGQNMKIYLENIKTIGPDSVTRNSSGYFILRIYKNYIDAFINNQRIGLPLQNDLRVKIIGNPAREDIANVNTIVNQLDSLTNSIDVKIVRHLPNITLNFDSISPNINSDKKNEIIFFPSHKKSRINNLLLEPEQFRMSIITGILVQELLRFSVPYEEESINNYDFGNPAASRVKGLSEYDKSVLKLAFSHEGYKKLTEKYNNESKIEFPGKLLLVILITFFLLLIIFEISRTYTILSHIKNSFLRYVFSTLIVSQVVIISSLIIYGSGVIIIEQYLIPFAILAGIQLYYVDKLLSKINTGWLTLILDSFSTAVVLIISYYIVFGFTMGVIQGLKLNNENILLILVSVIFVRILMRYQFIKMNHVIKEKDLKLSRQKELLVKSQLNAIQAKINPHFLYNSLNSLAELAKKDADKTEKMALSLSKIFQYNINKENVLTTSLAEEIKMIGLYLSIEKQRFSEKLEYEITVEPNLNDFLIPKFLLQPLVENAVKHGTSKITGKGIIEVDVSLYGNKTSIKIFDNGPDFPEGIINGYGLQNTYEKLDLVFQKPYEIRFVNGDNKHIWLLLEQ